MRNRPEDRQFDSGSVPELTAGLGLDVEKPPVHRQAHRWQDEQDVRLEDVANADEKLRGARKLRAKPAVNFAENRHDLDQQKDGNTDGDDRDRRRVHHGRFHFFPKPGCAFQVCRQP